MILKKTSVLRGAARVGSVLAGMSAGTITYWLYLTLPPTSLVTYSLLMLLGLLPLLVAGGLQRGGWRMWPRIPALLFIWFVTDTGALMFMMVVSQVWAYWRVIVADGRTWIWKSTEDAK